MPALQNPKHERFAQELAKGKTAEQAHELAGYHASRSGASQLFKRNVNISKRITEILAEHEHIQAQATADAIKSTGLTKAWVIEMLTQNVHRAMQAEPVLDRKGVPTGEYVYQGSVANRAIELLGKELGMFIDRKDVTIRRTAKELSDDELADILAGSREGNGSTEIDPAQLN